MRKTLVLILICTFSVSLFGESKKKIGLVLSGGGALGVAHIGVLKVMEEAGIPIDYISGTSMGALVGALYSIGYNAHELDSIVKHQDWRFLLSDRLPRSDLPFFEKENSAKYLLSFPLNNKKIEVPSSVLGGQNIYNLLMELTVGYHDTLDFRKLPIPFECVATDIVDGEPHLFTHGVLPIAMRASMAIPGVFSPITMDSVVLVDGGVTNNFPVDVCRNMGADIIVGVDLNLGDKSANELQSAPAIVDQMIELLGKQTYIENKDYLLNDTLNNLYLNPDLQGYSIASFNSTAIDSMIRLGEIVARKHLDQFLQLKERAGYKKDEDARRNLENKLERDSAFILSTMSIEGVEVEQQKWVEDIMRIQPGQTITYSQLNKGVTYLYGTGLFKKIDFRLIKDQNSSYKLDIVLSPKRQSSLNIGFRFDSETMASILLNTIIAGKNIKEPRLSLTARLSENPYFNAKYSIGNEYTQNFSIEYKIQYNDLDWYIKGRKISNVPFVYNHGSLSWDRYIKQSVKFKIGLEFDYFDFGTILYSTDFDEDIARSRGYFNYVAGCRYETLDQLYLPKKGIDINFLYKLYTTNFLNNDGHTPFSSFKFNVTKPFRVTDKLHFIPSIQSRFLLGNNIPFQYLNFMGGEVAQRYLRQQLSFIGIKNLELFENSLITTELKIRHQIHKDYYLSVIGNYAKQSDEITDILAGDNIWGGGVGAAYNSYLGPIEAILSLSNWDRGLNFYISMGFYF